MDSQTQHILAEALQLPVEVREDLAVRLMDSVGSTDADAAGVKAAWAEEIDRRVAKHDSGESEAIAVEDAWPKLTGKPWRSQTDSDG